jgi:hypothetical protein
MINNERLTMAIINPPERPPEHIRAGAVRYARLNASIRAGAGCYLSHTPYYVMNDQLLLQQ